MDITKEKDVRYIPSLKKGVLRKRKISRSFVMHHQEGYFHIMVAIFIFLIIYLIIIFLPQTHSVLNGMKQSETTTIHQVINKADTAISKRLTELQIQFNKMQGKK